MIASTEIQNKYINLYKVLREYLWDVDTLEDLSDVEVEIFTTFIDKVKLDRAMYKLKRDIQPTFSDDEDMEKAFIELEEAIAKLDDSQYAEIYNTALIKGEGYR